jgi:hypothetical protein
MAMEEHFATQGKLIPLLMVNAEGGHFALITARKSLWSRTPYFFGLHRSSSEAWYSKRRGLIPVFENSAL